MTWIATIVNAGLGLHQANRARRAGDVEAASADRAVEEQRRQFDLIRQDSAPYRNIGSQALTSLGSIYGYQPTFNQFAGPSADPSAGPIMGGGAQFRDAPRTQIPKMTPRGVVGNSALQNGRGMAFGGDMMGHGPIDAGAGAFQVGGANSLANKLSGNGVISIGSQPGGRPQGPGFTDGLNVPDYSAFFASPDYQFRRDEGMRGIENRFSAGGPGAQSGNALRALSEFNSNLAAGEFGNYFNRQGVLAGIGQTANNMNAQAGMQTAGNIGNALMAGGAARASGIVGQSNALTGGISNAVNAWQYNRGGGGAPPGIGLPGYGGGMYYPGYGWGR